MSRSLRSRKPLSKYPKEEFVLAASSANKPMAKKHASVEMTTAEQDVMKSKVVVGSKTRSTKGNLLTGWRTFKAIRTPVLRDRTNIPEERLKVDVLMKQGIGGGIAKRAAKRAVATRTSKENDDEDGKMPSVTLGARKKSLRESAADGNSKDTEQAKDDEVPKKLLKPVRKTVKSATSEKEDDEIVKKTSLVKTTRKTSRKARSENESPADNDSGGEETPKVKSATERTTSIVKKSSRVTKRVVKSTDRTKSNNKSVERSNSPKLTRKRTRKMESERESSTDSGEDTKSIVENDKPEESETEKRATTTARKLGKRAISKKVSLAEKPAESSDTAEKSFQRALKVKFVENDAKTESNGIVQKKFFKSKATIDRSQRNSPIKITVNGKRRNIGPRRNVRMSVSFRMRQPTLDESFAKQPTRKILRRRGAEKNYCEDTIVAKEVSENDNNDGDGKGTGPVYKSVKLQHNSINDDNEVYEFKFDDNDSREKLPKNKRRKIVRKNAGTKKSKAVSVPKKKITSSKARKIDQITKTEDGKDVLERMDVVERVSTDSNAPTSSGETNVDQFPRIAEEPSISPIIEDESSRHAAKRATKPTIVASMELKGSDRINLMATPVLSKSSEVKPRNVLRTATSQYGTMLKHALLNKSISPITKAIESFDPGSPWRPPTFASQEFSRVKNIVQSTPQVRKFAAMLENVDPNVRNEAASKPVESMKKESAMKEDDARLHVLDKRSPSKAMGLAKSPRKFGTVISNIDNSSTIAARNVESNENKSRENVVAKQRLCPPPIETKVLIINDNSVSHDRIESMNVNDENGDKENCLSSAQSPQRSPLKSLNRAPFKNVNKTPLKSLNNSPLKSLNRSPLKSLNNSPLKSLDNSALKSPDRSPLASLDGSPMKNLNESPLRIPDRSPLKSPTKVITKFVSQKSSAKTSNDENAEPQAGPSSSKMSEVQDDSRILRQSNLDNFLNIDEMPKSTRISTMHGIFDDPHSTPISRRKPAKKIQKDLNVDNAFGFDECDDSENDITPIERPVDNFHVAGKPLAENQPEARPKKDAPATARLSVGDIKKHLLPIRKKAKVEEAPIIERIEEEEKENRDDKDERSVATNTKIDDQSNLTDTFDLPSEKPETNQSTKGIRLFADLEPVHFKQAPRYSYKRKRAVGFFLSDDEDEIETLAAAESHRAKKRKVSKVEKEREKQIENWAKDINQTFEEIDHFDLVVE